MLRQYPTRSHPAPQPAGPPAVTVRELHHAALIQGGIFLRGSGPIVPGHAPIEAQQQQQGQGPQQQLEQHSQTVVVHKSRRRGCCRRARIYVIAILLCAGVLGTVESYFGDVATTFTTTCLGFSTGVGLCLCMLTLCNLSLAETFLSSVSLILTSIAAGLLSKHVGGRYGGDAAFIGAVAGAWVGVAVWGAAAVLAYNRLRSSSHTRGYEFDNPNIV